MEAVQVQSIVARRTMQVTATIKQLQRELGRRGGGVVQTGAFQALVEGCNKSWENKPHWYMCNSMCIYIYVYQYSDVPHS